VRAPPGYTLIGTFVEQRVRAIGNGDHDHDRDDKRFKLTIALWRKQ